VRVKTKLKEGARAVQKTAAAACLVSKPRRERERKKEISQRLGIDSDRDGETISAARRLFRLGHRERKRD
jgi:hypothetical protein